MGTQPTNPEADAPASASGGGPKREVAAMLPYAMLRYVERSLGRADADSVRVAAGEPKTLEEMTERGAWCTTAATLAVAEHVTRVTGELNVGRRGGEELFHLHRESGIAEVIAAEGSIEASLDMVITYSSRISTGRLMEIVERHDHAWLVEGRYQGAAPTSELFCNFALGYWSKVPSLFGADGYAVEVECQSRGDERCLTRVSWTPAESNAASDADGAVERRDQMLVAYEDLQKMAAELLAAEDVDTMLDLVVERAGTAVLAAKFLLVTRVDEGELSVHHRGFRDDSSARRAAQAVMAGDSTTSTLVVDIASPTRTFGKIAAFYPKGAGALAHDERLMSAYAGHAAAALEAAAGFAQAQRDRDTAQALLDLAHALAGVGTSEQVSERLATALVGVAGSDSASVWLWDEESNRIALAAAWPAAGPANLRPVTIDPSEVDGLAGLIASPHPVIIAADKAGGIIGASMDAIGVRQVAAVPVMARGSFLGFVSAGFRQPISKDRRAILISRLTAVASQAATALDNARLLERISHQALHDPLTGLPNRPLIEDRADHALRAAARTGNPVGLLFLDLDGFKLVNDTLGHHAGDELLCQVVARLQAISRSGDTLARLGGDEFLVLLSDVEDEAAVLRVADRLLEVLRSPFPVHSNDLTISASVGAALSPKHGSDYASLLQHSDAAMYRAKSSGGDSVAFAVAGDVPAPALVVSAD